MHVEDFPVSFLSLLPLSVREVLLWRLPIADVCLLEDTGFVEAVDMETYWKLSCGSSEQPEDSDSYVEEWGKTKLAKAILYGQVTSTIIDCLPRGFWFSFPRGREFIQRKHLIQFLYAVRNFCSRDECHDKCRCGFILPSRYRENNGLFLKEDIISAATNCFKGELPKVLTDVFVYDGIDLEYLYFLRELRYLSVCGKDLQSSKCPRLEFVLAVLKEATHLEVLIIKDDNEDYVLEERTSLDNFCVKLSSHPTFWSNFQLLKVLSLADSSGYVVSQENFNQLITTYLSAYTDHTQKVRFTDTKVVAYYDTHSSPKTVSNYLHFKTIELDSWCRLFSKYQATPEIVTHWLGQSISVLENRPGFCAFKVKDSTNVNLAQKRKWSEI